MEYRQDMPPPGGYAPITYVRVPLKPALHPLIKVAAFFGITTIGWVGYHIAKERITNERIESRCAKLSLYPMLLAERDRMMLKQLKRNRDAEEKIMKDVEGWEVGKWKKQPIYFSIGPDEFYMPAFQEYFAHAPEHERKYIFNIMKTT